MPRIKKWIQPLAVIRISKFIIVSSFGLRNSSFFARGPLLHLTNDVNVCILYIIRANCPTQLNKYATLLSLPALSLVEGTVLSLSKGPL
jgi:hypothetical protein